MNDRWNIGIDDKEEEAEEVPLTCWLCERVIGERIEWHHPVPKSRGGRTTEPVHPICHQTLHATFTNAVLARAGEDVAQLRNDPAIAKFLGWVADKPADFHARTRQDKCRDRGGRGRR